MPDRQPPPSTRPAGSSRSARSRLSTLLLRTTGECDFDPRLLTDVLGVQRQRFITVLRGFGSADWAAPTRCADWSAHEVVRHLCDSNEIGIATGRDDGRLERVGEFDPRTSPGRWLAASEGESTAATLDRFVATTGQLLALARDGLAAGRRFEVRLPYGPMDWTVLLLHAFWDSWIHERDVLLASGAGHRSDGDATAYAAGYGIFIAAAVASMFGRQVQQRLTLGGVGGGLFEVDSRESVRLAVHRGAVSGPDAAEVADALSGRGDIAAVLPDLPAEPRAALSLMADYFSAP